MVTFNNQAELNKYFRIIQPSDLLGKYSLVDLKGKGISAVSPLVERLVSLLINTGENQAASGLPTLSEIVSSVNTLIGEAKEEEKEGFHDIIQIYTEGDHVKGSTYWGSEIGSPKYFGDIVPKADKNVKLGVIMTSSPFITMNIRDTNKISLFMNAVPTLELSRAVPYLDVRFQFARPKMAGEQKLRVPSLLKFLEGASTPKGSDKLMNDASITQAQGPDGKPIDVYRAGMELFTSPQTLVNPTAGLGANRFVRVIDPFRPFMSIDSFEITCVPTQGAMSYKSAKLMITLHDRSRLGEISDLVRPEIYTKTTLSISYGWKHPDGIGGKNAFGDLINQMCVHNEKYGIVNCSYSFDTVGQCKITMQLAMKGVQDFRVIKIADSKEYIDQTKYLDELTVTIAKLREDAGLRNQEGQGKEVRAFQILDMAERGELVYSTQDFADIKALVERLKKRDGATAPASKELAGVLGKMFKDPKKGLVGELKQTIESHIEEKFKQLQEGPDPFLAKGVAAEFNIKEPNKANKSTNRVASFAKVLLTFVGVPLSAAGSVDEAQFFFYQFNTQAGKMGDLNIGTFPVDIAELKEIFKEHVVQKNNSNMTIAEFVMLLQGAVIQDPRAIGYGLRDFYTPAKHGAKPKPSEVRKGKDGKEQFPTDFQSTVVKNAGSFRYPSVEIYVETLAGRPVRQGETAAEKIDHDIMRIHVFDKAASPYSPMLQMIQSQTLLQDVVTDFKKGFDREGALTSAAISLANQSGLDIQKDKNGKFKITSKLQDLKNFITQVIPTITYGSNNSGLKNATVSTQQNALLSTTQMMGQAGRQNNTEPNGSAFGGIPLRVIPATLDADSFGCPLLNVNQQFYFDFQTGTTIDNIYLLTHLTHTIKQGNFSSHMKFVPLDAYGVFESVIAKIKKLNGDLEDL